MKPIEFSHVSKTFVRNASNSIKALTNITFTIENKGELFCVVGPDGAGKTTLLEIASGLIKEDSGFVKVFGKKPNPANSEFISDIGKMPQNFSLYPTLTVKENFYFFANLRNLPKSEIKSRFDAWMRRCDLAQFENRLVKNLSGGMKQKLGLACSLIHIPKLLILDEPTVGVDPISRLELFKLIDWLKSSIGVSILMSSAYLNEAQKADFVAFLDKGQLLGVKTPKEWISLVEGKTYSIKTKDSVISNESLARSLINLTVAALSSSPIIDAIPKGNSINLLVDSDNFLVNKSDFDVTARAPTLEDAYAYLMLEKGDKIKKPIKITLTQKNKATETIIVAKNLERTFGDFKAVNHTNFSVQKGEVFGLLGPNGAGKTTTFRMLCGLIPPSKGSLSVAGIDMQRAKSELRRKIGYVAQKFSLYERLTPRENLEYFAALYGLDSATIKSRIDKLTSNTELSLHMNERCEFLPLGVKRELTLACALIHKPEILFLDEPTSGADLRSRRKFWRNILNLTESGTTVVVTTHFLEEAEYCDRFVIQDAGTIILLGSPQEARKEQNALSIEEAFINAVRKNRLR